MINNEYTGDRGLGEGGKTSYIMPKPIEFSSAFIKRSYSTDLELYSGNSNTLKHVCAEFRAINVKLHVII